MLWELRLAGCKLTFIHCSGSNYRVFYLSICQLFIFLRGGEISYSRSTQTQSPWQILSSAGVGSILYQDLVNLDFWTQTLLTWASHCTTDNLSHFVWRLKNCVISRHDSLTVTVLWVNNFTRLPITDMMISTSWQLMLVRKGSTSSRIIILSKLSSSLSMQANALRRIYIK